MSFPSGLSLEVEKLALARGGRRLAEGLDFEVRAGEALIVTGPNGAGKSTLLRVLAGLLAPASGRIRLRGGETDEVGVDAHYLGHAEALKGSLTAGENLAFWAAMLGRSQKGLGPEEALGRVALSHVLDLPVSYLSAGQRRRVSIARLLVASRPLWLLDEPTTALDAASQERLARLMREHLAAGGMIVAATHSALGLEGARELRLGVMA